MMSMRLGSSLAAGFAGILLTFSAQAAPTFGNKAALGLNLRLSAPLLLAQASAGGGAPEPYLPPQSSSPYSQPPPGAYPQTAPGAYPQTAPGAYPQTAPGAYPQTAPASPYPQYAAPPPAYPTYYPPADMRPPTLPYDPDKPIPEGYQVQSSGGQPIIDQCNDARPQC